VEIQESKNLLIAKLRNLKNKNIEKMKNFKYIIKILKIKETKI